MARPNSRSGSGEASARPTGIARVQRTLITMAAAVFGVSALCVIVLLITRVAGVAQSEYRRGFLFIVSLAPLPGLALSLLFVIALIIVNAVARSRTA